MKLRDALRFYFLLFAFGNGFKAGAQFGYIDTLYNKEDFTYGSLKFSDNKFILIGYGGDSSGFGTTIFCINSEGDTLWKKKYINDSIGEYEIGLNPCFDKNKNIIIGGQYYNNALDGEQAIMAKADSNGNMLWLKIYPARHYGWGQGIWGYGTVTSYSDEYLLVCTASSDTFKDSIIIIRTDTNGNELGRWQYGTGYQDASWGGGIQTSDSGFLFMGQTTAADTVNNDHSTMTTYVIKVNKNGVLQWDTFYVQVRDVQGFLQNNAAALGAIEASDGYIIFGYTPYRDNDSLCNIGQGPCAWDKAWVAKVDKANGAIIWKKLYGPDTLYYGGFFSVATTPDSNYVLCGDFIWNNYNNNKACVYKIDNNGDSIWSVQFDYHDSTTIGVYPYSIHTIGTSGYMVTGFVEPDNVTPYPWVITIDSNGYSPPYVPDTITGVGIVNADLMSFKLYPNPSTGLFQLQMANPAGSTEIQVYNLLGEQVDQSVINQTNTTLNLTNLAPGIYLYKITTETNPSPAIAGKLVIAR